MLNLREKKKIKRENLKKKIEKIRAKIRGIPKKAKSSANIDQQEIFVYTEQLFFDEHSTSERALNYLIQAAKLGSDLFPKIIIDLLISQFTEPLFAKKCMSICLELASRREDYSDLLYQASIDAIIKNIEAEYAAAIILALNRSNNISSINEIKSIILAQYRISFHLSSQNQIKYPSLITLLNKIFDQHSSTIISLFQELLLSEDLNIRSSICQTLYKMQKKRATLGLDLILPLIDTLELPINNHGENPDNNAKKCLEYSFKLFPEKVDNMLSSEIKKRRLAVKGQIISVYHNIVHSISRLPIGQKDKDINQDEIEIIEIASKRCFDIMKDSSLALGIRAEASNILAISMECSGYKQKKDYFDSILGYWIEITKEDAPPRKVKLWIPKQDKTGFSQQNDGDRFMDDLNWGKIKRSALFCIKKIISDNPEYIDDLVNIYKSLDSVRDEVLKSDIISILGELKELHENFSKIMPTINHALMDVHSPSSRMNALGVIQEIYRYSTAPLPENILDGIILHLLDTVVGVHQEAVKTLLSNMSGISDIQKKEVFSRLSHLALCYKKYSKYKEFPHFIKELLDCLLEISKNHKEFLSGSFKVIKLLFPTEEISVNNDIAEVLMWRCGNNFQFFSFTSDLILYNLENYEIDRYIDCEHKTRKEIFNWLCWELPTEIFSRKKEVVLKIGLSLAEENIWRSIEIAALFNRHGDYNSEAMVLRKASESTKGEEQTRDFSNTLGDMAKYANETFQLEKILEKHKDKYTKFFKKIKCLTII